MMNVQKTKSKLGSIFAALLNREKFSFAGFFSTETPTRPQVPEWTKSETLAKGQTRQRCQRQLWPKGGGLL